MTTPCHLGGVRWWFVCPLMKGGTACDLGNIRDMPISQLGFALKVLTFEQKCLERLGQRLDRIGG